MTLKELKDKINIAFNINEDSNITYNTLLEYIHSVYYYYDKFYYFTFGSDPLFPYQNGYIIIIADNEHDAIRKFKQHYPNRENSDCLNFAFCYSSKEWENNYTEANKYLNGTFYAIIE